MAASLQVESAPISLSRLRAHAGRDLFAVLDSCDEPLVPIKLDEIGRRGGCLYSGKASVNYSGIAPYLVEVDDDLLTWILANLSGTPWGILLISPVTLVELRRHLRRFLLVKLPDDRTVYFRFYDPRVTPTFLKGCDLSESAAFFGPIERFVIQVENEQRFVAFARK